MPPTPKSKSRNPTDSVKNSRFSLKEFSSTVCTLMRDAGDTDLGHISQEMITLTGRSPQNIRRRIYDTINVLAASNLIIRREGIISWVGPDPTEFTSFPPQMDTTSTKVWSKLAEAKRGKRNLDKKLKSLILTYFNLVAKTSSPSADAFLQLSKLLLKKYKIKVDSTKIADIYFGSETVPISFTSDRLPDNPAETITFIKPQRSSSRPQRKTRTNTRSQNDSFDDFDTEISQINAKISTTTRNSKSRSSRKRISKSAFAPVNQIHLTPHTKTVIELKPDVKNELTDELKAVDSKSHIFTPFSVRPLDICSTPPIITRSQSVPTYPQQSSPFDIPYNLIRPRPSYYNHPTSLTPSNNSTPNNFNDLLPTFSPPVSSFRALYSPSPITHLRQCLTPQFQQTILDSSLHQTGSLPQSPSRLDSPFQSRTPSSQVVLDQALFDPPSYVPSADPNVEKAFEALFSEISQTDKLSQTHGSNFNQGTSIPTNVSSISQDSIFHMISPLEQTEDIHNNNSWLMEDNITPSSEVYSGSDSSQSF